MKTKLFYALFVAVAVTCAACKETPEDPYEPEPFQPTDTIPNTNESAESEIPSGTIDGHGFMDMGLPSGTKWATCNVGAYTPEGYGDYFAWGETSTKSSYDWETYKWCQGRWNALTKYNTISKYGYAVPEQGYAGFTDDKTQLDNEDDAAYVNWSRYWHTPTDEEWKELCTECVWKWTTRNNINGYKVTSKTTGKSIFLPAAGYWDSNSSYEEGRLGYYWTSSINADAPYNAWHIFFGEYSIYNDEHGVFRTTGRSIRPVMR